MSTPEVRVGDRVRITTSTEGVINYVSSSGSGIELDGIDEYFNLNTQNVEILERAPKVFTVGDAIAWSDLSLLKNGTVLVNTSESHETPRIVDSVHEYLVLNSIDRFPFSYYDDNMFPDFVIAYIPEG